MKSAQAFVGATKVTTLLIDKFKEAIKDLAIGVRLPRKTKAKFKKWLKSNGVNWYNKGMIIHTGYYFDYKYGCPIGTFDAEEYRN